MKTGAPLTRSLKLLSFPTIILSFLLIISNTSQAFPFEDKGPFVAIRLLPSKTDVKPGETITIGIEQKMKPEWHTYWLNPGDSGSVARVEWSGVDAIQSSPLQWPIPHRLSMGPLTNFGYENETILLQDITLPQSLPEGPQTIKAKVDILVCKDICIPETHEASFTINGDEEPVPAVIDMARTKLPLDMGWATNLSEKDGDLILKIETDTPNAFVKPETIELYPEEWGLILNPEATRAEKDGNTLILHHKRGDRALSEVPVSKLVVTYEDANGERKGIRVSTLSGTTANGPSEEKNEVGIWKAIIFALIGGFILNLMPCVFPILSMKALSLAQLSDKDEGKARLHGMAYTLGILVCFVAIAGILISLKAAGTQVGWGFQLQHPTIILFLSYLFFTLGLNLAGYFEINFGLSDVGQSLTQRGGAMGSFFTGVLATLVATPCTAPFMGTAMGYALTQNALLSLTVFVALGLGLALPYLAMCFIPSLRHALPKPGAWMETLRQFLAFPMFASACWLLWVLSMQVSEMGQFIALLGLLSIAFAIWLLKHHPRRITTTLLAIAALVFTISTFITIKPAAPIEKAAEAKEGNWEDFTRAKLESYLEGKDPVFVNMTAAWCITCKVNEKIALATPSTEKLFADNGVKYLKGDWTNQNPEITAFLEEYGRSGVPIYVYYAPRDEKTGTRPQAIVLPQILTPTIVENAIKQTGD